MSCRCLQREWASKLEAGRRAAAAGGGGASCRLPAAPIARNSPVVQLLCRVHGCRGAGGRGEHPAQLRGCHRGRLERRGQPLRQGQAGPPHCWMPRPAAGLRCPRRQPGGALRPEVRCGPRPLLDAVSCHCTRRWARGCPLGVPPKPAWVPARRCFSAPAKPHVQARSVVGAAIRHRWHSQGRSQSPGAGSWRTPPQAPARLGLLAAHNQPQPPGRPD